MGSTSDEGGTVGVEFRVNQVLKELRSVFVDGNATTTVTFEFVPPTSGTYTVQLIDRDQLVDPSDGTFVRSFCWQASELSGPPLWDNGFPHRLPQEISCRPSPWWPMPASPTRTPGPAGSFITLPRTLGLPWLERPTTCFLVIVSGCTDLQHRVHGDLPAQFRWGPKSQPFAWTSFWLKEPDLCWP